MTYMDLVEAIAEKIAGLWPERMLYRDFCPVDFCRPSGFLHVDEVGYTDAVLGLVEWNILLRLELYASTDAYHVESSEELRRDQEAVLNLFGGPSLAVGDRHIVVNVAADAPGPGEAYVSFTASWMDARPGYQDPEDPGQGPGGVPMMEQFEVNVSGKE